MNQGLEDQSSLSADLARDFFRNVYTYMFGALGISGILAYTVGTNTTYFTSLFISAEGGISPVFWVIAFAPLGIGLLIQWGYNRLSMGVLLALFILYSGLMGLSLSTIFLVYNIASIA
ncbi:MAG: hypothetical protein EBZ94_03545, partial [Crocinitomicaceae bacterium]|nr:hypothetical protein [Crocinitomicaceae bacterium]